MTVSWLTPRAGSRSTPNVGADLNWGFNVGFWSTNLGRRVGRMYELVLKFLDTGFQTSAKGRRKILHLWTLKVSLTSILPNSGESARALGHSASTDHNFSIFSPPLLEEFACPLVTSKLTRCRDSRAGVLTLTYIWDKATLPIKFFHFSDSELRLQ